MARFRNTTRYCSLQLLHAYMTSHTARDCQSQHGTQSKCYGQSEHSNQSLASQARCASGRGNDAWDRAFWEEIWQLTQASLLVRPTPFFLSMAIYQSEMVKLTMAINCCLHKQLQYNYCTCRSVIPHSLRFALQLSVSHLLLHKGYSYTHTR